MYYLTKDNNELFFESSEYDFNWITDKSRATVYKSLIKILPDVIFNRYDKKVNISKYNKNNLSYTNCNISHFIQDLRNFIINKSSKFVPNMPEALDQFEYHLMKIDTIPEYIIIMNGDKNINVLACKDDDELFLMKLKYDAVKSWKPEWNNYFPDMELN